MSVLAIDGSVMMHDQGFALADLGGGVECCCEPDQEIQACCFDGGSCADLLPKECIALGGVPQGAGVLCRDIQCPECLRLTVEQALDLKCPTTHVVHAIIVAEDFGEICNYDLFIPVALNVNDPPQTLASWEGSVIVQCPHDGGGQASFGAVVTTFIDNWFIGIAGTVPCFDPPICSPGGFSYAQESNPCACPPLGEYPIFLFSDGEVDVEATILELQ